MLFKTIRTVKTFDFEDIYFLIFPIVTTINLSSGRIGLPVINHYPWNFLDLLCELLNLNLIFYLFI